MGQSIRSTSKSPNDGDIAADILKRVSALGLGSQVNYCPCGERREYNHCKAAERLEKIYEQTEHPEKVLSSWHIPKKHINSSFDNFQGGEVAKKICSEAVKKRDSVFLTGFTGCGKTHLAVAMLRQKVENNPIELEPDRFYQDETSCIFVTAPELLLEIRQTFNNSNLSEAKVVDKYTKVPLLVLDDLGAEKTTEWAESTLYIIIDRRNREEMWTIVTSNLELDDIERCLGARIASRLSDMKVVKLKLPDYRKKRKTGGQQR